MSGGRRRLSSTLYHQRNLSAETKLAWQRQCGAERLREYRSRQRMALNQEEIAERKWQEELAEIQRQEELEDAQRNRERLEKRRKAERNANKVAEDLADELEDEISEARLLVERDVAKETVLAVEQEAATTEEGLPETPATIALKHRLLNARRTVIKVKKKVKLSASATSVEAELGTIGTGGTGESSSSGTIAPLPTETTVRSAARKNPNNRAVRQVEPASGFSEMKLSMSSNAGQSILNIGMDTETA